MQGVNWNDLKYVQALARQGTLVAAARVCGVDGTTVARRIAVLEGALGAVLFQRGRDNLYRLTEAGQAALGPVEDMAEAVAKVQATGRRQGAAGTVRITAVAGIVNGVLVPQVAPVLQAHQGLTVELVSDARAADLTERQADIALRLARPRTGGQAVVAARLGQLGYGVFAAPKGRDAWICYEDSMGHLPHARWVAGLADGAHGLRVADAQTAQEAAAAGLGRAVLPVFAARVDRRLHALNQLDWPALPRREVWMLSLAA